MLTYIIIVNDNGEFKTVSQTEIEDVKGPDETPLDVLINIILDVRSAKEQYDARVSAARGANEI